MKLFFSILGAALMCGTVEAANLYPNCQKLLASAAEIKAHYKPPVAVSFDFPGLKIASLSDPTLSTGATLFYFPNGGAETVFDARGGSVASAETTLLEEGSYSHNVDGLVFAGGSTMGLAAGDGARSHIFRQRAENANEFDFIPSFPGAVVYDYDGRIARFNDRFAYPNREMGAELFQHLSDSTFWAGRYGAGTTTTFGKVAAARWGGQGLAETRVGPYRVLCAVVLNASGDIFDQNGKRISGGLKAPGEKLNLKATPGHNTTLSLVVTDAPLTRDQLKRLAVMVHTSMAAWIRPFHTSMDGDILFASTTAGAQTQPAIPDLDFEIGQVASETMRKALTTGIRAANEERTADP